MSRTIRRKPSSGGYMRRMKHVGYRKCEELTLSHFHEDLFCGNVKPSNRHKSWKTRIPNPWDDKNVSHYRGQEWHRKQELWPKPAWLLRILREVVIA